MTKEELEKEAKEYAEGMAKYYASTHEDYIPSQFEKYLRNAYISSAYPREKHIEELKKECLENESEARQANIRLDELIKEYVPRFIELKNIMKNLIQTYYHQSYNKFDNVLKQAEQFLKECE